MNFTLDLKNFVAKAKDNISQVVHGTVMEVGARIVEKSPVGDRETWAENIERAKRGLEPLPKDYKGGRFRGNWQYGFNTIPQGDLPDIDPTGAVSVQRITANFEAPAAGLHYLVNNLAYAQVLEEGHSSQAPQGMVELTLIEAPAIVEELAAKVNK